VKRICIVIVVAACGPRSKSTAPPTASDEPVHAALFEKDKSWTFAFHTIDDVESETSETGFEKQENTVDATCTVTEVVTIQGGGKASWIACDLETDGGSSDPLSGLWIVDDEGVYHVAGVEMVAEGSSPERGKEFLIFDVPIAERSEEQRDPEFPDPIGETSVTKEGDTWCWSQQWTMGDEAWASLCIDALGPTKGTFGWAGGSVHEADFTRK
jgi:hypothetical protein